MTHAFAIQQYLSGFGGVHTTPPQVRSLFATGPSHVIPVVYGAQAPATQQL